MHNPRYRCIYVALKKELPRKLTNRETLALHRAVRLSLWAEVAGADSNVPLDTAVKLENSSCRARAEWSLIAREGATTAISLRRHLEQARNKQHNDKYPRSEGRRIRHAEAAQ